MTTNDVPMDHLTALVRERRDRLHAEAAAERLARAARPGRGPGRLLRLLGLTPDPPPGRRGPGPAGTAADHDLCA